MKTALFWGLLGVLYLPSLCSADAFQEAVQKLTDKNPTFRKQGADKLSELRNPAAIGPLSNLLADPSPQVRSAAIDALGVLRAGDLGPRIAKILETDPDPWVRQAAAVSLGYIANRTTLPSLLAGLKDSNPGTRYACVNSLAILRDGSAVKALTEELKSPDPRMRYSVSYALSKIGDKSSVPAILETLKVARSTASTALAGPDEGAIAASALRSLGELGDKSVIPKIKPYLDDKDPKIKISAAHALHLLGDKSGVPVARKYLKDKDADTRSQAVRVLGSMGTSEDLSLLKAMAKDPDPQVQESLKYAIQSLSANVPKPPPAAIAPKKKS